MSDVRGVAISDVHNLSAYKLFSFELSDTMKHTHQRVRPLSVKTLFLYERLTRNLWWWSYLQHWNRDPHSRREHHIAVVVGISSVCVRALLSFRGIRLFESASRPWKAQHVSIEAVRERLPCSMLQPLAPSWMMLFNVTRSPTSKVTMVTSVDQVWRQWKTSQMTSSGNPRTMKFHAPAFDANVVCAGHDDDVMLDIRAPCFNLWSYKPWMTSFSTFVRCSTVTSESSTKRSRSTFRALTSTSKASGAYSNDEDDDDIGDSVAPSRSDRSWRRTGWECSMLWPLNPSGITSFNCTQAILGRLSKLRNTLDDDVRFLDRRPTRLSTVSLESSEANVVDSESTDSSDDVVSQSSMMTLCWTSVLHTSASEATSYWWRHSVAHKRPSACFVRRQIAWSRDPELPSEAPYSNDEDDDN